VNPLTRAIDAAIDARKAAGLAVSASLVAGDLVNKAEGVTP
jgi:hypothetical protein